MNYLYCSVSLAKAKCNRAKFLQWRACEADFRRREIKGIPCVRSVKKTHPKQGLKPLLKAVASQNFNCYSIRSKCILNVPSNKCMFLCTKYDALTEKQRPETFIHSNTFFTFSFLSLRTSAKGNSCFMSWRICWDMASILINPLMPGGNKYV